MTTILQALRPMGYAVNDTVFDGGERNSMQIRAAVLADLKAVSAIYNDEVRAGTSTFDTEPRDSAQERAWFYAHQSEEYPLLVAVEAGTILGWASLSAWSERGAYAHTVEGSVFVHRDHRGSGVARELVAELISRARTAGHWVILGRIEAANAPSRQLVLSAGFSSIGVMHRVGQKFGRTLDVELFELLLPPSAGR